MTHQIDPASKSPLPETAPSNIHKNALAKTSFKRITSVALDVLKICSPLVFTSLFLPAKIGLGLGTLFSTLLTLKIAPKYFKPKANISSLSKETDDSLWTMLFKKTCEEASSVEFLSPLNVHHRFDNVYCPKNSAVKINDKYLHANFVGKNICSIVYVASQAPLNEDLPLFWQFVFNGNFSIIDLTSEVDQEEEDLQYYPALPETIRFYDKIALFLKRKIDIVYEYEIEDLNSNTKKTVTRINYNKWPDAKAIELSDLKDLIFKIKERCKGALCVHCRAGIGRTGTLITALILEEKIKKGEIDKDNFEQELINIIVNCRKERSESFVQTRHQFSLLRKYGNELLNSL